MKKREAIFGAAFMRWYQQPENRFYNQAVFEYKITMGNTFNLNTWRKKQGHQESNLKKMNGNKGIFHTFSDLDPRGTPADAFFISDSPAFLVIWYGKYDTFFMIPVKEIPKQTSISYKYCCLRFIPYKLLKIIKPHYEI